MLDDGLCEDSVVVGRLAECVEGLSGCRDVCVGVVWLLEEEATVGASLVVSTSM